VPRAQDSVVAHRSLDSGLSRREPPNDQKGLTMRFGKRRGAALAAALGFMLVAGTGGSALALGIVHTIPREVDAVDVNTGGPYFAPPIPYGHYAKGCLGEKTLGLLRGCLCKLCLGKGCGACGGTGHCGGLFGHGGCGHGGCGHDGDPGCGGGGLFHKNGCVACGGSGCGFCAGQGLLQKHGCAGKASTICASAQASPSPQVITASPQFQCPDPGCGIGRKHFHRLGNGCTACGGLGNGCGICGGHGLGDPCSACGGRGCALCSKAKGLLGMPQALINKLFHVGEIKYFVGPGGPVPLTPGYVPYVVTTRSPRDFLAFPPFSPVDP
jgi:hypothetical protein